jgi:glycosyltransferase involved in cell wall biosynthesis
LEVAPDVVVCQPAACQSLCQGGRADITTESRDRQTPFSAAVLDPTGNSARPASTEQLAGFFSLLPAARKACTQRFPSFKTYWANHSALVAISIAFFDMPPTQVLFLADAWQSLEAVVRQLATEEQFDLLWCEEALCYWLLKELHDEFQGWQLIASAHNIEFILRNRLKDTAADQLATAYWESQVNCCRRLESKIFLRAALTIVCSSEDAEAGRRHVAAGNFTVVQNGVDTAYFARSDAERTSPAPVLLFTGGFGYDPNSDAVRHFVTKILPIVRCSVPDCKFVFAGREARRLEETLALTDPLVTAIDSPEDMRPVFESATVFVVPLLSGGGTRLKILEAMAMQLPIVSTAIGAEGIDCSPGEHLLIADSDREFARVVVELLQDETRRRTMGHAARTWVCANMDWKIHREQLKSGA